jgi:predicted 3-demethylubiquinone-9 3-methyltransferase (glyoxalase superfamily)
VPENGQRVTTCLWFDTQAEEAAKLYTSLFDDSQITAISRKPDGQALMVEFELGGVAYQGLNGGPVFQLSEACSLSVACDSQAEIDRLWSALVAGGGEESQCGWLKDRFGLSWQIVPSGLGTMMTDPDPARVGRVAAAFMSMKKFDLAALEAAYRGDGDAK